MIPNIKRVIGLLIAAMALVAGARLLLPQRIETEPSPPSFSTTATPTEPAAPATAKPPLAHSFQKPASRTEPSAGLQERTLVPNVAWSELLDVPITARRRSTISPDVEIEFTETTTIRADGTYVTVLQSSDTPVMSSTQGTWSPHEDGRGICWHSAIEKGSFCTVFEKVDGQWYLVHRDTGLRWGPYVLAQEPR